MQFLLERVSMSLNQKSNKSKSRRDKIKFPKNGKISDILAEENKSLCKICESKESNNAVNAGNLKKKESKGKSYPTVCGQFRQCCDT